MSSKSDTMQLLRENNIYEENEGHQPDGETNKRHSGANAAVLVARRATGEDFGTNSYATSDEEVFETREVVTEGDKKKVTYIRKTSVHDKKKDTKHCHSNVPITPKDKKSRNKLIIASVLCLIFMTVEIVGGLLAGSLAIISDAAHLLTDFASFMISLVAIYLASRPATQRFNYGWHRAEILGAFASIILLWILTGVLAYEAVMRIVDDSYTIDSEIMLITAGIGVAFNLLLGTTLHQHGHSHGGGGHGHSHGGGSHGHSHGKKGEGHGHSHGGGRGSPESHGLVPRSSCGDAPPGSLSYGSMTPSGDGDGCGGGVLIKENNNEPTDHHHVEMGGVEKKEKKDSKAHKKEKNINVKAAFVHVVGDLLQSIGVLVAAFIIYFKPEWKIADPICTFFFSLIVVVTTINIMRDIIVVLMEGKPRSISFTDVRQALLSVDKVKDTHNLRMWSLTMDKVALSVHLVVDDECDAREVLKNASLELRSQFNIMDITIQVEEYVQDMDNCNQCIGPS